MIKGLFIVVTVSLSIFFLVSALCIQGLVAVAYFMDYSDLAEENRLRATCENGCWVAGDYVCECPFDKYDFGDAFDTTYIWIV